jgi:hypothetical protein
MDRYNEQHDDDLIELGAVSVETKGPIALQGDTVGLQGNAGLSDD